MGRRTLILMILMSKQKGSTNIVLIQFRCVNPEQTPAPESNSLTGSRDYCLMAPR
jgi:hypothetical protein